MYILYMFFNFISSSSRRNLIGLFIRRHWWRGRWKWRSDKDKRDMYHQRSLSRASGSTDMERKGVKFQKNFYISKQMKFCKQVMRLYMVSNDLYFKRHLLKPIMCGEIFPAINYCERCCLHNNGSQCYKNGGRTTHFGGPH